MNIVSVILLLFVLLLLSAAFSGSEAACFSVSPWRIKRLEREGSKTASIASMLLEKPERLLITILLGNETVNSVISQLGAVLNRSVNVNRNPAVTLYSALISAGMLMIFGEITPKGIALRRPMRFIGSVRFILVTWSKLTRFISTPLDKITRRIVSAGFFSEKNSDERQGVRSELERYITLGEAEGAINPEEGKIMKSISSLDALTVRDVITPRHLLAAVGKDASIGEVLNLIHERHHSRILVYDGDIDNIIGKVILKDLVQFMKTNSDTEHPIRNFVLEVIHVPDQINLGTLLVEMQRRRETMAVIFDEYGGTLGLVTLEDIIEEIVGDIKDDKDQEKDVIRRQEDGSWIVSAGALIRDLQREIGFPSDIQFAALHGYLSHIFGRIPEKGETISDDVFGYEIISARRQRIGKVKISPLDKRKAD